MQRSAHVRGALGAALAAAFLVAVFGEEARADQRIADQAAPGVAFIAQASDQGFSAPPVAIAHGLVQPPRGEAVAPLGIHTSAGSNFYIKLVECSAGCEGARPAAMTMYATGGRYLETLVPLGVYELRYAAGDTWYGTEHRFGPETIYYKADALFDFHIEGNQYMGYTVELILRRDGNLETEPMEEEEF